MSHMLDRSSEDGVDTSRDALSEILQDLRPTGVSYGHCRFRRPWGFAIAAAPVARLRVVVAGGCWLRLDGREPIRLAPGDAAFLPGGVAHTLAEAPSGPARPLAEFSTEKIGEHAFRMTVDGDGDETVMACCSVRFDQLALHPLLESMPPVIIVRCATCGDPTLRALLDAMADEVTESRIGGATILARLADVVIARLIRAWAENEPAPKGWLAALRDKRVGRALAAIHRDPGRAWPLDELAARAGLSRSVFCERFAALVGVAPGHYLARWRMRLASQWLQGERLSIAQAADRLGYGSEAAFSRAFKRITGAAPSTIRRTQESAANP
jgi:AraC-like DNA-binding protein